ncbi:hypothetical protein PHYSODRAFT_329402 [Phytophthora sojae]|uniref:Uncharacterized protein n=1 Tax=Phytophthora sojae (strain P6497) TaxID=1094619 RepID=G4Z2N1_PHYSP|nr:hypothetical protein PHYSODRAFT_329402 [Phytophthora sojae]EGZ21460.1 hypothetical protein PHYSODRAFT_329402 [Phytophthora sojae]|eukprot:XP_009524177.1 hypothetical protein PHYSODRAFT_329402 [Phytophthora sojae]
MRACATDNRWTQYRGSIDLEHSDGVREPSLAEDGLVGKAGEDEGRDLALLQRCRGRIVEALLVSMASVSALVVVGNDVNKKRLCAAVGMSPASMCWSDDVSRKPRREVAVADNLPTKHCGSIGLEHSDGVREPSLAEDGLVGKAGEDEGRDLALLQRCRGRIVEALLVSMASVLAPVVVGNDVNKKRLCAAVGMSPASMCWSDDVSRKPRREVAWRGSSCVFSGGGVAASSGNAILYERALPTTYRQSTAAPSAWSTAMAGESDGVREPSLAEDGLVGKAGEDEGRDLALLQRCRGRIVEALLVSTASVSALVVVGNDVNKKRLCAASQASSRSSVERVELRVFWRRCGRVEWQCDSVRAGVADNLPTKHCGSIGLEHSDGVREPSLAEDGLVGKAGEDEGRDLALLQRCRGRIVEALLVSTASVSALVVVGNDVNKKRLCAASQASSRSSVERVELRVFWRRCGRVEWQCDSVRAGVADNLPTKHCGSIGLEHSDGVREPSLAEDGLVGKAGEDEGRDLALLQPCRGRIVEALLVSTASVSALVVVGNDVNKKRLCAAVGMSPASMCWSDDVSRKPRREVAVADNLPTKHCGSIGLEHSDGVREPSLAEDGLVGKAGEDEGRDLALLQPCRGRIVEALLVSTASVSALVVVGNDVNKKRLCAAVGMSPASMCWSDDVSRKPRREVAVADNLPTKHCGSIGLEHSDGVREPSLAEDGLVGKAGEDEGRDLALLQRCRGRIVEALLVSTASVSALVVVGDDVNKKRLCAAVGMSPASMCWSDDVSRKPRREVAVADNLPTKHCGSIGLEHSDGVREPSLAEDGLVGKAGEDEGRDLALLQRCRGRIVEALLVSTASVSALVVVGNDVNKKRLCAASQASSRSSVERVELRVFWRRCGRVEWQCDSVRAGVADNLPTKHCGSIGLEHSDGVREPSLAEDGLVGKAGEDEGRDLALLQPCRGRIVEALLVSMASVLAPVVVGNDVNKKRLCAAVGMSPASMCWSDDVSRKPRREVAVADNLPTKHCGSIGLEHSDGVREPSLAEDGLVGKAGEDEGRDLALLQRCRGRIVEALLVSTASVSALVVVGNDVNKKRLCAASQASSRSSVERVELRVFWRRCGRVEWQCDSVRAGVADNLPTKHCGSIGLEHSDGVREPSLAEDGLVGKAGEDEGRDLALLQRCRGRIVEALLVSMASVLALVVVGNDVNKKRLCAASQASSRSSVERVELRVFWRRCGRVEWQCDSVRAGVADNLPTKHCGSIGLEHSDGVREPSLAEDGLVGKAGEDEGRDLALLQRCRGRIVEALLVSLASVLALVVVGNDVNKKRLCAASQASSRSSVERVELRVFWRRCGRVEWQCDSVRASVADNLPTKHCGSIGLEHSDGVREPSLAEDGLVGKAGEDEGRDLALLQRCRGRIVEALLVSMASVLALVVVGNDVNKKRLCAASQASSRSSVERVELRVFWRRCGRVEWQCDSVRASVADNLPTKHCGSIGLEHSDGVREPSLAEDGLVGKAGEDEGRDLALLQRCRGRIVEALLVSMASVLAPVVVGNDVNKKRLCAASQASSRSSVERVELRVFWRRCGRVEWQCDSVRASVADNLPTKHCGSIGLEHSDGVREPSLAEDGLVGKAGEDEGRDLALLQRCRGRIVEALLVSMASVSAPVVVGNDVNKKRLCAASQASSRSSVERVELRVFWRRCGRVEWQCDSVRASVADNLPTKHCGSIGLEHSDGVREPSLAEDGLVGKAGEDEGRDLALLQRCRGRIVEALLVSMASVSAPVVVGNDVNKKRLCAASQASSRSSVERVELRVFWRRCGRVEWQCDSVRASVADNLPTKHCGSIGLEHSDGVREPSLAEDGLVGKAGEDEGRDLALLQRCRGRIVEALLVSMASVSAPVVVGNDVNKKRLCAASQASSRSSVERVELRVFWRRCGRVEWQCDSVRAGVADNLPTKHCGSIGLEHSDGVREPSLAEDGLVGKAGEDEGRDLALLQRCRGRIVEALLVSMASVSAPVVVGNDVNKKRLCAASQASSRSSVERVELRVFWRRCGRVEWQCDSVRASVADNLPTKHCGSIGLEHSDGVREPSLAEDGLVGKAGEDEGRDLALLQRCRGRIVEALLVSMVSVSAPVVVGNDVNKKRLCAASQASSRSSVERVELRVFWRRCGRVEWQCDSVRAGVADNLPTKHCGSIGLEHSDGVREPSLTEDGLVGKAGEDEGRDLALLQRCRGRIVEALLVSTASKKLF